jgi:hypothetical protein
VGSRLYIVSTPADDFNGRRLGSVRPGRWALSEKYFDGTA